MVTTRSVEGGAVAVAASPSATAAADRRSGAAMASMAERGTVPSELPRAAAKAVSAAAVVGSAATAG